MALYDQFPKDPADLADFTEAAERYILRGYLPEKPFLKFSDRVVTAGSCFAEFVANALSRRGSNVFHIRYDDGLNNPVSTDAIIAGCLDGTLSNKIDFEGVSKALHEAELFALTIGVALLPVFEGELLAFRPEKHQIPHLTWAMLDPTSIAETTLKTINRIRAVNGNVTVVLSLSPIPLSRTRSAKSVFAQDCVSKSSIRVGIEQIVNKNIQGVYYWPSFEMTKWLSPHVGQIFGIDGKNNIHIPDAAIDRITGLFIQKYFAP